MAYNPAAMEMEPEKLKALMTELFRNLQKLEIELIVHRLVILAWKETGLLDADFVDHALQVARDNPGLKQIADKYDLIVSNLSLAIHRAASEQELAELLRSWKPTGQPN
jgi:DNA-binding phage protein